MRDTVFQLYSVNLSMSIVLTLTLSAQLSATEKKPGENCADVLTQLALSREGIKGVEKSNSGALDFRYEDGSRMQIAPIDDLLDMFDRPRLEAKIDHLIHNGEPI